MSWTEERVEALKRMWAEGLSASQIAKDLGQVTRNAVIGKVHRLGLSNRDAAPADTAAETPTASAATPSPEAAEPRAAKGTEPRSRAGQRADAAEAAPPAAAPRSAGPAAAPRAGDSAADARSTARPASDRSSADRSDPPRDTAAREGASRDTAAPRDTANREPSARRASAEAGSDGPQVVVPTASFSPRRTIVPAGQPLPPQPSANEISPETLASAREVEKRARKLTLMELTERTCKWPIGDPATDKFWFCGLPSVPGKPYCEAHVSVAFQPMSSRRDRRR